MCRYIYMSDAPIEHQAEHIQKRRFTIVRYERERERESVAEEEGAFFFFFFFLPTRGNADGISSPSIIIRTIRGREGGKKDYG